MTVDMFGYVHGEFTCVGWTHVEVMCLYVCSYYAPVFAIASAWVKQYLRLFISDVDVKGWPSSMAQRSCQGFAQTGRQAMGEVSLRKNAKSFGF